MIASSLVRRWRPILVCLMMFGYFIPWIPSRISPLGDWGNTPHYLVEYDRLSGGLPTGELGAGYFQPEVYYGFEVVWIYLIGFLHFLGFHTLLFSIGLGAVLSVIYNLMSLSIYFLGNRAMTWLISRAKSTSILCIIVLALGGLESFTWSNEDFKAWAFAGYTTTFMALVASMIFEFKKIDTTPVAPKPILGLRTSLTLIVSSLFLPILFLPPSSAPASDCEMLKEFVVPASRWANMDENALQTWIEESPNFDNLVEKGSFANTNYLDYKLKWYGYAHEGSYEAVFTDHYLRAISAGVSDGIPLGLALDCFGEPEAYLAYIRYSSTGLDAFLVQFWFPAQGLVLDHEGVGDFVQPPEINGQLKIDSINFVQPGSIEAISDRAFLIDGSWLFPNWAMFIKPWPGSAQALQVMEITEELQDQIPMHSNQTN